jgi:hypothetical protein
VLRKLRFATEAGAPMQHSRLPAIGWKLLKRSLLVHDDRKGVEAKLGAIVLQEVVCLQLGAHRNAKARRTNRRYEITESFAPSTLTLTSHAGLGANVIRQQSSRRAHPPRGGESSFPPISAARQSAHAPMPHTRFAGKTLLGVDGRHAEPGKYSRCLDHKYPTRLCISCPSGTRQTMKGNER